MIDGANFWAAMFVVIAFVTFFSNFLMNTLFGMASELLTERIRNKTFDAILKQDIAFFDNGANTTGSLTSRLSSDAQKIQGISGVTLGTLLTVLTNLIGGIIVALIYGWKLGLVATCCLPVLVFAGAFRIVIITYFSEKARGAYEKSAQVACEAVAAIRTVQSLTKEDHVLGRYTDICIVPMTDGVKSAWTNTLLYALSASANFLINALVFWYGGQLIAYENYSLTQMFTVFIAIIFGSMGAGRIFAYAPDLKKAKDSGENVINLLSSKKSYINSNLGEGKVVEKTDGQVEFKNVRFNYPSRPSIQVLKGLNLVIKPGQFAALVGPSGCGKSTTVGLIERFYDVSSGSVTIDDQDIKNVNVTSMRHHIGLVSQEPNLFDFSIGENIAFGCKHIPSQEEIEKAAKDANIHDVTFLIL